MKSSVSFILAVLCFAAGPSRAVGQDSVSSGGRIRVAVITNPYSASSGESELSQGPAVLAGKGLQDLLAGAGCVVQPAVSARLTEAENKEYGAWNRMGIANGHLAELVARSMSAGHFPIGLLANCNSLVGMLAGLQRAGPGARPRKVGLMWIDAHADFNTPETTLSGMLGGMPVAVSAGLCLTRYRLKSGLDPALVPDYITMAGVRDIDPLEQELVDRHRIARIPTKDLRAGSQKIHDEMQRLSALTDLIYIHIDMDVLDPREVSGHSLTVPEGPTSPELAAALKLMFRYPNAAALGIASYPAGRDPGQLSLKAAYNLIAGAIEGLKSRSGISGNGPWLRR